MSEVLFYQCPGCGEQSDRPLYCKSCESALIAVHRVPLQREFYPPEPTQRDYEQEHIAALEARIAELEAENAVLRGRIKNALLFYDWEEGVILSESDQAAVIGGVLLALYGDGVAVEQAADGGEEE